MEPGGVTGHDGEGCDVPGDHAAGGGHSVRAHGDTWGDKQVAAIQERSAMVMGAVIRLKAAAWKSCEPVQRNARWERQQCEPDANGREIEDEDFLADPGMIAHFELPRKGDVDPGPDHDATTHPGAKSTEQGWPGIGRARAMSQEKEILHDGPQHLPPTGSPAVEICLVASKARRSMVRTTVC